MIKVGFICEGKTEKKIVESEIFQQFLKTVSIDCIKDIIDAEGNGNLLPENLSQFTQRLIDKDAEKIIILTDLDEDACIAVTKERINAPQGHTIIISVKKIEAWFLADDECISSLCKTNVHFEFPEEESAPFESIRQLLIRHTDKGVGDKILLASRMLNNNFSILNAANHPSCPSAKYFVEKLKSLGTEN